MVDGKIEVEISAKMDSSSLDKAAKQTQKRMEKIGLKDLPLPAPLKKFAESLEKGLAAFKGPTGGQDATAGFKKMAAGSQANNSVMINHLAGIRKGIDRVAYILMRDEIYNSMKKANKPGVLGVNADKARQFTDQKFGVLDMFSDTLSSTKKPEDSKKSGLLSVVEPIKQAGLLFKDSVKSKGFMKTMGETGKAVMGQGEGAGGAGIASMIGPLAGLMIIGQGIFGIISAIFGMIVQSSPALQHVIKILNRGFNYILRPMGDILAMLLMPVARFFKLFGKKFMNWERQRKKELKAQGIKGAQAAQILGSEAPGVFFGMLGEEIGKALGDWIGSIDWGKLVMDALTMAFNWSGIGMAFNLASWVYDELKKALGPIGTELWNKITGIFDDIKNKLLGLGSWIWERLTSLFQVRNLGQFGSWIWTTVTQAFTKGFDFLKGLGTWLWNTFTGIFTGFSNLLGGIPKQIANFIIGGINGIVRAVKNLGFDVLGQHIAPFGWLKEVPTLDTGGIARGPVTANLAMNGKPELIAPLSQLPQLFGGMGGGTPSSINVNISGNVYGVNDLKSAIKGGIDEYYRTTGRAR